MTIKKAVLIFFGTLFVGLGVLGMILPLMPTTVFLLLAAYCYSKSSERFHSWLLNNSWCGEYIRNYQTGRGMTIRQKTSTMAMLWPSIGFSMWFVGGAWWLNLLLIAVAAGVSFHILRLETYRPESASKLAEGKMPVLDDIS